MYDIDKALSVDYVYPNLNSSELECAKVDSGNFIASKTHVPFDNWEWSNKLGLKDKGNVFDVQSPIL